MREYFKQIAVQILIRSFPSFSKANENKRQDSERACVDCDLKSKISVFILSFFEIRESFKSVVC